MRLLKTRIGCSLHGMCETRWSAGLLLDGIQFALQDVLEPNLTAKARNEINWVLACLRTVTCVLMSAVRNNILAAIDISNNVNQARDALWIWRCQKWKLFLKIE